MDMITDASSVIKNYLTKINNCKFTLVKFWLILSLKPITTDRGQLVHEVITKGLEVALLPLCQ